MWLNMFAASTTVATAVVVFNPLDCLRIRWQVQKSHTSVISHLESITKKEGIVRGLWTPGVGSNAVGAAVSRGVGMGCYPSIRNYMVTILGEKSGAVMF